MTLPTSGTISASNINVEMNRSSVATFSLNDSDSRTLAGKTTSLSTIAYTDFYNKSTGIPAGAIAAPTNAMSGISWSNLANATDGTIHNYALLSAASVSYGAFITAAVAPTKSKVSAQITWSANITAGQVFIKYSTDGGTSWVLNAIVNKDASWSTITETLLTDIPVVIGTTKIAFYIWIYSSSGITNVYINEITLMPHN